MRLGWTIMAPALAAAIAADGARAAEPRPLPVSCLYLHASIMDEAPGKAAGRAEIAGAGVYPALKERAPAAAQGSLAVVVIMVDWDDQEARRTLYPASYYEHEYFQSTGEGDETVRDYYDENSGGRFALGGTATGWLRSGQSYSYYVNGDGQSGTKDDYGFDSSPSAFAALPYATNVWGIVREAVDLADEAGVDFSRYDADGDGVVDAVVVIHAGAGAERAFDSSLGANQIWSHKSDLADPAVVALMGPTELDGVRIGAYNLVPEIGQTGVYAHEFGHILGLPDLYRTYVQNGATIQESTVGVFCLMDAGSLLPYRGSGGVVAGDRPGHMNPFFKSWFGWIDPEAYEPGASFAGPATVSLDGVERGGAVVRILGNPGGVDWENGGGTGEYFLLEARDQVGFDQALPGKGMLVWHISEARADNDSAKVSKRLAAVVEAEDGAPGDIGTVDQTQTLNLGEPSDFYGAAPFRDWTPDTDPSSDLYGGRFSGIVVTDVTLNGARVSFDLHFEECPAGGPYVFPNPWRLLDTDFVTIAYGPEGGVGDDPSIEIYEPAGTLVRTLDDPSAEILSDGARFQASWDGTNDAGRFVASGVYLFVVRARGGVRTGKIAIVR